MNGVPWTVGQKLLAAFSAAALTVVLVAIFGYQSINHLIDNNHWVDHTHEVQRQLTVLQDELTDAETGQRGFVITGDDAYLDPYNSALGRIDATFDDLRTLTADNADEQRRLDLARPLIDSKMAELKLTIATRRSKGFEATQKIVMSGVGISTMDDFRRIVAEMDADETALLLKRSSEAEASAQTARTVIVWGSLGGMLFIGLLGWFIAASLTKQVGSSVGRIQSSSAELQAAANQQASGAREQATSMSEISTTISELLATSRQIAESAQRVAHIAGDTAQAAGRGGQTVDRCQEAISSIRRQVDLIVGHMLELGRKSQQIGGILEIINELAEQTNILSINASVEAAGAGEAGRRFSVVADEIRKLADRVGASTKEIRTLVEEVRSAVNTTVMATEGGAKAVEAGTRQFSEVAASFQGISSMVSTSTEAAREIELSTKQQATAVDQVTVAVSNVAQATRETEASANQTLQTAGELTALAGELARLIQAQDRALVRA
ncbi:MAG TPA: CHASE3 domain-containing protein [bacterium]|jgi:CHASE3 domain sensor protein|nr:CHASE3 domain-containing protein [bacterium]